MRQPALNEQERLQALYSKAILDTAPEKSFDRIVKLTKQLMDAPVGFLSLIDSDRQWLKAANGCSLWEMDRRLSICTWTIQQTTPLVVTDLAQDPRFADKPYVSGEPHFRFYAGAPLTTNDGHNIGALCCLDFVPRTPSNAQLENLQELAQIAVEAMELRLVAMIDALTGSMMRLAFVEAARRDLELAKRHRRAFSCVLIDIDNFKAVNDRYGHAGGDIVLSGIVKALKGQLRSSDYIGRLGGEEFALILRETPAQSARLVAERLRIKIANEVFRYGSDEWQVTASFGVSGLESDSDTLDHVLATADRLLYRAKALGRNRVEMQMDHRPQQPSTRVLEPSYSP